MTAADTLIAGRYRIIRTLGTGGMGRVWLASDEVLRREVAIKEIALPFGLSDDEREEMRERSLREARAAARLSHPNVVQIYDVQHGEERPWIVMEYVRSRSLLQLIKENGPLPVDQVAGVGLAVLSALDAANRVGVLHRDVKPSNVLIADDGRVVLTDFGSALIDEGEGALTRTGVILGSPQYIAPERVNKGVSTPEADLWSLGATLYDAVEGRPPYSRETTLAMLVALATDKPDPMQLAGPLKPVLKGLLQKNPDARMKPAQVEEHLRRLADVETTVQLRHVPAPRRPADLEEVIRYEVTAMPPAAALAGGPGETIDAELVPARPVPLPPRVAPPVPRRRNRRWQLAAAAGVMASVLTLGVGAVAADLIPWSGGDEPTTGAAVAGATPSPSVSSPVAASVTPSAASFAPPATLTKLPATFSWWKKTSPFQVAVPKGWTNQPEGRQAMFFCAPGGPPTLRVRDFGAADQDFEAVLLQEEFKLDGYRRLRMETQQGSGGLWEYTYNDPKAGLLRGLDRVFVVGDRAYLIQWRVAPARWRATMKDLDVVTRSFQVRA